MAKYLVHKAIDIANLSAKEQAVIEGGQYIASPKYDGCHVIFLFSDGASAGVFSRTGEKVLSMQHIADVLPNHFDLGTGQVAVCGEAWWPNTPFSVLSGHFRRHSPSLELGFVPFDIVPFDIVDGLPVLGQLGGRAYPAPYSKRIASLVRSWRNAPSKVIKPIYFEVDPTAVLTDANAMAHHYKDLGGYDGVVLAKANGKYVVGAGKGGEFLKFKPLMSVSLVVDAVVADIGPKTGKNTCSLAVTYDNKIQMVSTGLTQAEVDQYVADPQSIIGKTIEVEAMDITNTGLLREPRYKGIRTDA